MGRISLETVTSRPANATERSWQANKVMYNPASPVKDRGGRVPQAICEGLLCELIDLAPESKDADEQMDEVFGCSFCGEFRL